VVQYLEWRSEPTTVRPSPEESGRRGLQRQTLLNDGCATVCNLFDDLSGGTDCGFGQRMMRNDAMGSSRSSCAAALEFGAVVLALEGSAGRMSDLATERQTVDDGAKIGVWPVPSLRVFGTVAAVLPCLAPMRHCSDLSHHCHPLTPTSS